MSLSLLVLSLLLLLSPFFSVDRSSCGVLGYILYRFCHLIFIFRETDEKFKIKNGFVGCVDATVWSVWRAQPALFFCLIFCAEDRS